MMTSFNFKNHLFAGNIHRCALLFWDNTTFSVVRANQTSKLKPNVRKFTSSPFVCVDEDLEQGLDPYSTYLDSPIESDVEESSSALAEKYIGDPSGLMQEQTNKMESLTEKSKLFISEILHDRELERSKLQASELEGFDQDTREIINEEGNLYKSELNLIATITDDAIDLNNGRSRSHDSDYESDYESVTSENRVNGELGSLDSNTAELENDHTRFITNALERLESNYANTTLDTENDTSCIEPASNVPTNTSVEAGPSNFSPAIKDSEVIAGSSKKRKLDDTEMEIPAKKVKVDNSGVETNDTLEDLPSNNQSPLDYVLEKQQSDPYDFNDDID